MVTVATSRAIDAQPPLAGPMGTTTSPSTRWSTRRRASSSSRPGSPSASATSVLRGRLVELALDRAHQLLVPEVGQAADEQADDAGRAAGQGAGDRIGLVAELLGGLAHPSLGLGGHLQAAQRVAHGGRREARVLRQLADRDAAPGRLGTRRAYSGLTGGGSMAEAVH